MEEGEGEGGEEGGEGEEGRGGGLGKDLTRYGLFARGNVWCDKSVPGYRYSGTTSGRA